VNSTTIEGLYDDKNDVPYANDGSFTFAKNPQQILNAYNQQSRGSVGINAMAISRDSSNSYASN